MDSQATKCLNCGAELQGPYCHECGQKLPRPNPTIGEVFRSITEELAHWDGKIPSTIATLLFKPGRLTLDFFEGRRARWLPPLRLYLICSVVFFLVDPAIEAVTGSSSRRAAQMGVTVTDTLQLTPELRAELDSSIFSRVLGKERVWRLVRDPKGFQKSFDRNSPKVMFVLLPLFALLTRLVYWRAGRNYPAHLFYALHVHAAAFGGLTITKTLEVIPGNAWEFIMGFAALGYILWYALRSARVVFGGSAMATLGRMAIVGVAYWMFFLGATFTLLALTILSG